jgi:hypothetical protein
MPGLFSSLTNQANLDQVNSELNQAQSAVSPHDGIVYLQRLQALAPNLFEVFFFDSLTNAGLYCKSIKIPAYNMTLERHAFTRRFFLKEFKLPEQITITWLEDSNLSVWRYHTNWLKCFYTPETDTYISGSAGKKRDAAAVLQRFTDQDGNGDRHLIDNFKFALEGLVPLTNTDLEFGWDKDSSNNEITISYTVDRIAYQNALSGEINDVFALGRLS